LLETRIHIVTVRCERLEHILLRLGVRD